ncbi:MAG TPA: hypothetical protein VHD60_03375 [Candidatus Saccharimonadales bacterium]|nr:hypothetical protein [Candidatus Saccharimonadales bacterium]
MSAQVAEIQPLPGGLYASLNIDERIAARRLGLHDVAIALDDGAVTAKVWFATPACSDASEVAMAAEIEGRGIWVGDVPTSAIIPTPGTPGFKPETYATRILDRAVYPARSRNDAVRYMAGVLPPTVEPERAAPRTDEFQEASRPPVGKITLGRLEEAFVFASAVLPPRVSKFLIRTVMRGTVRQLQQTIPVPILPG